MMTIDQKNKKVLVTGAGGFIGSHLCEHLVRQGYNVRAFVRYNSTNSWGWLEKSPLTKEMEIISGDLRDFDSVDKACDDVVSIFHLGALIGIPYSYKSPLAYIRTNIEGTYNVLEAGKRNNVQNILVTSTSEVYGTARYTPIDESHPLQPQSPYSASKIAADNLALSYNMAFNTRVAIARPFNTFGPRQSARAIIPTIITQLLAKKNEISLGSLSPVRDLTFVEDTVAGMVKIAETEDFIGKVVNIGSGAAVSVGELVEKLCKMTGVHPKVVTDDKRVRPEKSEVMKLISDNKLLVSSTGWKPNNTLEQGLQKTIDWFKENNSLYKTDIYNI